MLRFPGVFGEVAVKARAEGLHCADLCLRRAALYPAELVKQLEFNRLDGKSFLQIVPNVH